MVFMFESVFLRIRSKVFVQKGGGGGIEREGERDRTER